MKPRDQILLIAIIALITYLLITHIDTDDSDTTTNEQRNDTPVVPLESLYHHAVTEKVTETNTSTLPWIILGIIATTIAFVILIVIFTTQIKEEVVKQPLKTLTVSPTPKQSAAPINDDIDVIDDEVKRRFIWRDYKATMKGCDEVMVDIWKEIREWNKTRTTERPPEEIEALLDKFRERLEEFRANINEALRTLKQKTEITPMMKNHIIHELYFAKSNATMRPMIRPAYSSTILKNIYCELLIPIDYNVQIALMDWGYNQDQLIQQLIYLYAVLSNHIVLTTYNFGQTTQSANGVRVTILYMTQIGVHNKENKDVVLVSRVKTVAEEHYSKKLYCFLHYQRHFHIAAYRLARRLIFQANFVDRLDYDEVYEAFQHIVMNDARDNYYRSDTMEGVRRRCYEFIMKRYKKEVNVDTTECAIYMEKMWRYYADKEGKVIPRGLKLVFKASNEMKVSDVVFVNHVRAHDDKPLHEVHHRVLHPMVMVGDIVWKKMRVMASKP